MTDRRAAAALTTGAATGAPAAPAAGTPRPARIAQIGIRWFSETAGGAARYYHHLVDELLAQGVDVRGLVLGSGASLAETGGRIAAFADDGMSFLSRMRAARRSITTLLADFRPELVASHFAMFALPALDRIRRHPHVVHFHGPWAGEARAEGAGRLSVLQKRLMETAVYRRADRLIVLSEAFGRVLIRDYGVQQDRVRVVPGGVDAARFARTESRAEARARLGWPQDRPLLLAVRRLKQRMGLTHLIAAMADVRRRAPDALLLIAGCGPLREALQARVDDLGLQDHVRFLGFVADPDLPVAYRAADLAIMPTRALEGFGLTAVEALAAGTPVLVTPVGGLPEVVRGLDPALILPGHAAGEMARGIAAALAAPARLPDAAACAAYARARFDWPIVTAAVQEVYREVL